MYLVTDLVTYQEAKAAREALGDKNANLSDIQFEMNLDRAFALKGRYDLPRYKDTAFTRASAKADGKPLPSAYPIMVTFSNPKAPETVQLVDPDDLGASFGKGVRLKRITFQRTDDPVSLGIDKRLTWLKAVGEKRGTLIPNPPRYRKDTTPIQLISPSDFNTELFR